MVYLSPNFEDMILNFEDEMRYDDVPLSLSLPILKRERELAQ
jgi:hypothetical protein